MDGDVHAIVLQTPINASESQDIAVIEIEKTGKEEAILQVVGDPLLYGEDMIVEPFEEEASESGKGGPSVDLEVSRVVVNVWLWPSVRVIYAPAYRPWVSPWKWGYYPAWWKPWKPYPVHVYHAHVVVFRQRPYHRVTTHRVARAHRLYTPGRSTSTAVASRSTRVSGPKGNVSKSATTRTVTGPGGKTSRSTTTKTVSGPRGNSASSKSTTTTRKNKKTGATRTKTTRTHGKKRGG